MEDIAKKISVRLKGVSGWHRIRKLLKREYDFKITDTVTLLDTAAGSNNLGDEIIMKYAMKAIGDELEGQDVYRVASHLPASDQDIKMMNTSKAVIVCGTNFLSPMMEAYSVWKFDERMINMKNMVLLAVGSGGGDTRDLVFTPA